MVRKSPAEHAKAYMGRRKRGLDGNWWTSLPNQKGIYRWVPQRGSTETKTKPSNNRANTYFIHDNGGRPFKVVVNKSPLTVYIYKAVISDDDDVPETYGSTPTKVFRPEKLWVPPNHQEPFFKGNSLLLQFPNNVYIYVGSTIMQFISDAPICKFEAPVGPSDVPYAYAVDQENKYYLLIDSVGMKHVSTDDIKTALVPRKWFERIDDFIAPYHYYYAHAEEPLFVRRHTFKLKGKKVLVKRLY